MAAVAGIATRRGGVPLFVKSFVDVPVDDLFAAEAEGLDVLRERGGAATHKETRGALTATSSSPGTACCAGFPSDESGRPWTNATGARSNGFASGCPRSCRPGPLA